MAKILVVDDDLDHLQMLTASLVSAHHVIDTATTGDEAMNLLTVSAYDLVILDWILPDTTGIDLLKWYRRTGSAPVLMLTGQGAINNREEGLDSGADDYLIKPFSTKELAARIRALLRRPPVVIGELSFGEYKLNSPTLTASRGEINIRLSPTEFALLEFLARHPAEIFKAEVLMTRIWSAESDASTDALRATVKRIRSKFDEPVIEYIAGAGYKLIK